MNLVENEIVYNFVLIYLFFSYFRNMPKIFWMPAKHNSNTKALLDSNLETFKHKEKEFISQCEKRLDERIKHFDERREELNKIKAATKKDLAN